MTPAFESGSPDADFASLKSALSGSLSPGPPKSLTPFVAVVTTTLRLLPP